MKLTCTRRILCFNAIVASLFVFAEASDNSTSEGPENKAQVIIQSEEVGKETESVEEVVTRQEIIYPSNWGSAGIFRVRSAESLPDDALTFGVGGEFYYISSAPNLNAGNTTAKTIAENLFFGYSPTDRLTLSIVRRNSSTTFGNPQQLISSLGDINFSAQYSFPLSETVTVAPIFNFLVASNFNALAPSGNTVSAGGGGALTYSFLPTFKLPLFLYGNLIYHIPQIRDGGSSTVQPETYFNFSRFHTLFWGLGLEMKMGNFIPFIELFQTSHLSSGLSFASSPSKFSLGTRMTPLSNKSLAFLLGVDVGLGKGLSPGVPFSPPYQVIGQISYTVGLSQTERKHYLTTKGINIVDRKFVVKKNINFKVGSHELESSSLVLLDEIAKVIKQNKIQKLLILGHTDSTHTEHFNFELSVKRAHTVKNYLVQSGVPEESLNAMGYGKRKPKATNVTESGRALNRRVEFFILE